MCITRLPGLGIPTQKNAENTSEPKLHVFIRFEKVISLPGHPCQIVPRKLLSASTDPPNPKRPNHLTGGAGGSSSAEKHKYRANPPESLHTRHPIQSTPSHTSEPKAHACGGRSRRRPLFDQSNRPVVKRVRAQSTSHKSGAPSHNAPHLTLIFPHICTLNATHARACGA